MFNKNMTKIFLLTTLVIFLLGIASATETNENNTITNKIQEKTSIQEDITHIHTNENDKKNIREPTNKSIQKNEYNKITTKEATQKTRITVNKIPTRKYNEKIEISGKLLTNNKAISGEKINITINKKKYTRKTDTTGKYMISITANKIGTNNVTITYHKNRKYTGTSTKTTFKVTRQTTKISLNYIKSVCYKNTAIIKGKYTDNNNKALKNTVLTININNKKYTRKTDVKGVFTYNYKTKNVGTNNVTVSYKGNHNYIGSSVKKTFKVTKMPTTLNINSYGHSSYGKSAHVTGKFTDKNDNALKNSKLNVFINGKQYYTKTDTYGKFYYSFKTRKAGTNRVTVSFSGNDGYVGSKDVIEYEASKMKTKLILNKPYYTTSNDKISVNGRFYDAEYNNLKNTLININIDGKTYKTKTDEIGYYNIDVKPTKQGTNTVKVSFTGNDNYMSATNKSTVFIPLRNVPTKITLDPISGTTSGNYVYISGRFTDNNYNALKNTNILLNINGAKYTVKTDDYGYYYYSYKTSKTGTNTVTASFNGNEKYNAASTSTSFTVKQDYSTIELYTYNYYNYYEPDRKYVGNDVFQAWYQTIDAQWDKGVYIEVYYEYGDLGDAPDHLLIDATFYFKNSAGNVISRQYDDGNGAWMSHDLVSGYTPYKVVAKYRKMTENEKYMFNNGYAYNPRTKEWDYIYGY